MLLLLLIQYAYIHTYTYTQLSPRKISLSAESPVHSVSCNPPSPLVMKSSSMANLRRDSSPGLGIVAMTPVLPTVNVMSYNDDSQSLDRQGIIDITADVQNFLAAISRLKQAMEEVDATSDSEGKRLVNIYFRSLPL